MLRCLEDLPSVVKNSQEQPTDGVTLAPKLKASMSVINFCDHTRQDIDRIYRSISEKFPLHCQWNGKLVKLHDMVSLHEVDSFNISSLTERNATKPPGSSFYHKRKSLLCIKCKDGWVAFRSIGLLGKKQMPAKDFYNGFLSKDKNVRYGLFTM